MPDRGEAGPTAQRAESEACVLGDLLDERGSALVAYGVLVALDAAECALGFVARAFLG